jgi:hypothetical protein
MRAADHVSNRRRLNRLKSPREADIELYSAKRIAEFDAADVALTKRLETRRIPIAKPPSD